MSREDVIKKILDEKIVVVTRGIYDEELIKLCDALYEGGIRMLEVTFDETNPDTNEIVTRCIRTITERFHGDLVMGAGTVLKPEQVWIAKEAGAQFIVSPNFNPNVVKTTLEAGLVSMPGCMTPTEICAADECGADFIKLFPAGTLGIKYCKDIYAPIHHVRYVATVGVTEETFEEYLKIGFAGAGISSKLVDKKCREEGNYAELTERARRFVAIAKKY